MWLGIKNEVRRGELLEAVPELGQPLEFGRIALVGIESKELHLECSTEDIFELTDEVAGLLLAIRSSKLRYETFINKLQNVWQRLSLGSAVSVSLSGSSVPGVVRYMGELPSQPGTWFGVELMVRFCSLIWVEKPKLSLEIMTIQTLRTPRSVYVRRF